ncbi:SDR family oxidoreductase [Paragemmobacter straminiformis]|uniref:SDR family oxidoreductase n=1 Tax=Paragemmobacter straminiformis TaxID=2045119 RepID=A0A842I6E0_9RHOB|nr:SDR family oxidoreductase [Gemmobacter straminiformis]MBC2834518.1 SDR family oxidoreductase [Gemmobacter straminiformis]
MAQFSGKTALITGALGTIGQTLVARFVAEGAQVVALDRPGMEESASCFAGLPAPVRYFGCDLNDLAATETAVTRLCAELDGVDILINNAAFVVNKPHEAFSIEEYETEVRINSSAAFILTRACSAAMKEKRQGKIINLTSLTLTGHWEGFVPYVASKGAMYGLVKSLSRELGHYGINVNGISPGAVLSDAEFRHFGDKAEEYDRWILERQSLKRRILPEDISNLAVFLASAQADLITGQNIHCDGGW